MVSTYPVTVIRESQLTSNHPKGRPAAANATRHASSVENDQTRIVGLVARNADGVAAIRSSIGMVDAHVGLTIVVVDEARVRGRVSINIVDESMSRVWIGKEAELVEEVAIEVVVFQHILSPASGAQ